MGLYRKLSRWPHYLDNPAVLEMDSKTYAKWYYKNVLLVPGEYAKFKARRAAETPEQRRERRRGVARIIAFLAAGVLKIAAAVAVVLVGATFGAAKNTHNKHI